jgi:heptosyltransferase-2
MKILIRGANWIGDAVMTIPAMRELRRLFPEAEITLYTRPWAEGIFRDAEFIDDIDSIDISGSRLRSTFDEAKRLRAENYDLAVLFPNSFESAAVVRLAGVERRFGYARDARSLLLSDPIETPAWKDERHQVYYYLNIVAEIERRMLDTETVRDDSADTELNVNEVRRADARAVLLNFGCDVEKPIVAFGAGSTNSMAKRWGEEKFALLGDRLQSELGADLLLLGSPDESDVSARVSAFSTATFVDLTGKTDLALATAILSEVDLFVSNDMGLAHIAAAVGTKTLVIFGPTIDTTTRPFASNAEIIRHDVECSPCMLRECPIDHRCMTRVTVDDVFLKAKGMLNL